MKYELLSSERAIDIQFSSAHKDVGKELQAILSDTVYHSDAQLASNISPPRLGNSTILYASSSSNARFDIVDGEGSGYAETGLEYNVVTDTTSLLPYVGIWDVKDYNGIARLSAPNGKNIKYS